MKSIITRWRIICGEFIGDRGTDFLALSLLVQTMRINDEEKIFFRDRQAFDSFRFSMCICVRLISSISNVCEFFFFSLPHGVKIKCTLQPFILHGVEGYASICVYFYRIAVSKDKEVCVWHFLKTQEKICSRRT